jgi:hypothetical protein
MRRNDNESETMDPAGTNKATLTSQHLRFTHLAVEDGLSHKVGNTAGGGLNKLDPRTETFTRYQHQPDNLCTDTGFRGRRKRGTRT